MRPLTVVCSLCCSTRDALYNDEEGTLRMYLRGRPVVLYAPSPLVDNYDITKVATPPHSKLKLDWVYPLPFTHIRMFFKNFPERFLKWLSTKFATYRLYVVNQESARVWWMFDLIHLGITMRHLFCVASVTTMTYE